MAVEIVNFCDFCGKHQNFVKLLIAGKKVHICDECVDLCAAILTEKRGANSKLASQQEEA